MKKRICILYTGGTIGMVPSEKGYVPSSGAFLDLLRAIPDLYWADMPAWDVVEFEPLLDSSDITVREWNQIGSAIAERYEDYDGFVVLHGTDTMAYHEAVSHVEDKTVGEERIVQVVQAGFTMDEEVLRHAKVVVAN